jgi:hypothetical protein
VIPSSLDADPAAFAKQLDAALQDWMATGRRGVWLKIPIEKAALVEVAVDRGFIYHHAEAAYVMLTRWLPTDSPSPLPANASTQVGVGAVVINDEGKVLLLQEAVGPLRGRGIWKIPTGLLDAREDIQDGVIREVQEETGITATFERVVAFRHWHGAMFGKSDMFFVCILRARGCTNSTRRTHATRLSGPAYTAWLCRSASPRRRCSRPQVGWWRRTCRTAWGGLVGA